jgi:hypothetical protein
VRVVVAGSNCIIVREDQFEDIADYGDWTAAEIDALADEADEIISQGEPDEC